MLSADLRCSPQSRHLSCRGVTFGTVMMWATFSYGAICHLFTTLSEGRGMTTVMEFLFRQAAIPFALNSSTAYCATFKDSCTMPRKPSRPCCSNAYQSINGVTALREPDSVVSIAPTYSIDLATRPT